MKKINIIYLFLLFLPIIDLVTSITNRFFSNIISLGMIIKGIVIILGTYYIIFKSASKYRKSTIIFFSFIFLYCIGYFIFKRDLLFNGFFITEFSYIMKLIYFPMLFFIFLNVFDDLNFDDLLVNRIMLITLITYIILIVVPTFFNLNFTSYANSNYFGSVGWFYSANEISTILILTFPFLYILMKKNIVYLALLFIAAIYMISLIGTKVTLFGIIIVTFLLALVILFKKTNKFNKIFAVFLLMVTIMFMLNNYAIFNFRSAVETNEQEENKIAENIKDEEENEEKLNFLKKWSSILLSDRDIYALNTYHIYNKNYKSSYLLFGMGFSNTSRINNEFISKLIEIDVLDAFFHLGILSLFIIAWPYFYTIYLLFKKRKKYKFSLNSFLFIMIILLTLGISSLAGHVYLAPAVSIYIALYFMYLYHSLNFFEKKEIRSNKIAILALHLGYGGVENVISNVSSLLANHYSVEIITLYKNKEKIPFKLSKKVKITYLMNTISNKKEFLTAFREFKIFKVLKEGIKSCYILLNKKRLIKKGIINSDAKVIISTRYSFSKILNDYGRKDVIKIHQEHTFNINEKYLKRLKKLDNIDYIMPVSSVLYTLYQPYLTKKLKYIPLSLNYYPKNNELSNLNNANLIAMGRLEKEKGFDDLLLVLKEVIKERNDVILNLFGDGSKKEELKNIIEENGLNNNVKLWGFKNHDFIKNYLKNSSLYVMTSLEESFGLSVLEALSYGIPCIYFDSAKGVDSFVDDKCSIKIKNRDIKKMGKEIINYLNLKQTQKLKYQENARLISSNYSNIKIKEEWLKFIKEILNKDKEK